MSEPGPEDQQEDATAEEVNVTAEEAGDAGAVDDNNVEKDNVEANEQDGGDGAGNEQAEPQQEEGDEGTTFQEQEQDENLSSMQNTGELGDHYLGEGDDEDRGNTSELPHSADPAGGMMDDDDEDMPLPNRLEALFSRSSRGSRTPSSVVNLRGSRPSSAAIAQEIEGFEDDFMERMDEEKPEAILEEEEMEEDLGPSIDEVIDRANVEGIRLREANELLQRRVRLALDFRNKGRPPVVRDASRLDGVSTRYRTALRSWVEMLEDQERVEGHYQSTIFDMKSSLEERIKRADDILRAYKHFRMEVAKSSEHSKTGRPISERLLMQLEGDDQVKEEEVQRVRLKNIHLTNQLKKIETSLRQKEELAEGLHLIDFEQLKIENQSLNEKIEERNEELMKLRKKTTTTVQILTHVREKLQCVEKENGSLTERLAALEGELSSKRDHLGKTKASRDKLRMQGRRIKETSVYITNTALLEDIESQKETKDMLGQEIERLRAQYAELAETINRNNAKIAEITTDLTQTGQTQFAMPAKTTLPRVNAH